jgi:hypothetical protein
MLEFYFVLILNTDLYFASLWEQALRFKAFGINPGVFTEKKEHLEIPSLYIK